MVNKFVYNAQTSSLVPGGEENPARLGRALRVLVVAAAIGASVVGMGIAAQSADGATPASQR